MDNNRGITCCGLLTIFFIVLKTFGVITWSWLWVLSPIWVSLIGCVVIIVGEFIVFTILYKLLKHYSGRN